MKIIAPILGIGMALMVSCNAQNVERTYQQKTITVRMVAEDDSSTSLYITEHGTADFVLVEAFYWTEVNGQRLMLHKDAATPVTKGDVWSAYIPLPIEKIDFLRVREMRLLTLTEFGRKP